MKLRVAWSFFFQRMRLPGPFIRVPGMRFFPLPRPCHLKRPCHLNGLYHLSGLRCLGGLGDDSGCPTEAVEVCGYSLGVLSDGLYVVKTNLATFYRLANLRDGTIEF